MFYVLFCQFVTLYSVFIFILFIYLLESEFFFKILQIQALYHHSSQHIYLHTVRQNDIFYTYKKYKL